MTDSSPPTDTKPEFPPAPTVESLLAAIETLHAIVHGRTAIPPIPVDAENVPQLAELYHDLLELRTAISAMAKGDLATVITRRNFLSASLKAHQANLFHLTWQAQMVESGAIRGLAMNQIPRRSIGRGALGKKP